MGFAIKKIDPLRKVKKKLLGRNSRFTSWGYWKKKTGLNHFVKSFRPQQAAFSSAGDVYGHTGSIVGRF